MLWHNSTLANLKEFIGTYTVAFQGPPTGFQQFGDFLHRNQSLRILKDTGLEQYTSRALLESLPPRLDTLHIGRSECSRIGDRSCLIMSGENLPFLAKSLLHLTDLAIVIEKSHHEPYDTLEDIATALPNLTRLVLWLLPDLELRPTLNTISRAWRFYWRFLSNQRCSASLAGGSASSPNLALLIKSLNFITSLTRTEFPVTNIFNAE